MGGPTPASGGGAMGTIGGPPRVDACPKRMRHGPCGGVGPDSSCEVPGVRCPFPSLPAPVGWRGAPCDGRRPALPEVLVDFRPDPTLPSEVRAALDVLAAPNVGVLVGEHVDDPTPHRPSVVADAVVASGIPAVVTVTCRGRIAEEIVDEVRAVWATGAVAVHCVTGDHPRARLGLDQDPFFGADSIEVAAVAAGEDIAVTVAESPAAPPVPWRPARVLAKQQAGAGAVVLNHAGSVDQLVAFVDACHRLGVTVPMVAPVPVVSDRRSAAALQRFPGLVLPPGLVEAVLDAPDPRREGVVAAAELGRRLLASGRFAGVNLSGAGAAGGAVAGAEVMAAVVRELRR